MLFTQGVNEWQMLSNLVRSNSLQSQINAKSLRFLQHYAGLCTVTSTLAHPHLTRWPALDAIQRLSFTPPRCVFLSHHPGASFAPFLSDASALYGLA